MLLYRTAEWHAFAKLRLHTDSTLQHFEKVTTQLGKLMREFRDITESSFATFELPKEKGARQRRQTYNPEKENTVRSGKKVKSLNLFTYKWHALGDYVRAIRLFGGTDGFSTQVVCDFYLQFPNLFTPGWQGEHAHRTVKRLYGATNKRNAEYQIAKRVRRLERANLALGTKQCIKDHTAKEEDRVAKKRDRAAKRKERAARRKRKETERRETGTEGDSDLRYHISASKNSPQDIFSIIRNNLGDPAYHVSFSALRSH